MYINGIFNTSTKCLPCLFFHVVLPSQTRKQIPCNLHSDHISYKFSNKGHIFNNRILRRISLMWYFQWASTILAVSITIHVWIWRIYICIDEKICQCLHGDNNYNNMTWDCMIEYECDLCPWNGKTGILIPTRNKFIWKCTYIWSSRNSGNAPSSIVIIIRSYVQI